MKFKNLQMPKNVEMMGTPQSTSSLLLLSA